MAKIIPFKKKVGAIDYFLIVCQLGRDNPEQGIDALSRFLLQNPKQINRISYLAGLIHGALMRSIRTDAISHEIPGIIEEYGKPKKPNA